MKKENSMLAAGIIAGAATGVLLGILFAPQKGSRTRRKIVRRSEDSIQDLSDKLEDFVKDLNKQVHEMKEKATG